VFSHRFFLNAFESFMNLFKKEAEKLVSAIESGRSFDENAQRVIRNQIYVISTLFEMLRDNISRHTYFIEYFFEKAKTAKKQGSKENLEYALSYLKSNSVDLISDADRIIGRLRELKESIPEEIIDLEILENIPAPMKDYLEEAIKSLNVGAPRAAFVAAFVAVENIIKEIIRVHR